MATIDILLSSRFDDEGFEQAKSRAKQVARDLASQVSGIPAPELSAIPGESTQAADDLARSLHLASAEMQELAKNALLVDSANVSQTLSETSAAASDAAAATGELSEATELEKKSAIEAAKAIDSESKQVEALAKRIENLSKLSTGQILAQIPKEIKGVKELNTFIDAQIKKKKDLAKIERELGNFGAARRLEKEAQAYKRAAQEVGGMTDAERKATQEAQELAEFLEKIGVSAEGGAKELREQLEDIAGEFRKAADEASNLDDIIKFEEQAQEADRFANSVRNQSAAMGQFGKDTGILFDIMKSKFNQLGFVMFITQNTIKSILNLIGGAVNAIEGFAATGTLFSAFNLAVEGAGVAAGQLSQEIIDAAKGYITYQDLLRGVINLTSEGSPQLAQLGDDFAAAAANVEASTGGLIPAKQAFDAFIKSVKDGDANVLSSIPGFKDIALALDNAKLKAESTGQAFGRFERTQFIIDALTKKFGELDEEVGNLADRAGGIKSLKEELGLLLDSLGAGIVGLVADAEEATGEGDEGFFTKIFGDPREFAAEAIGAITQVGAVARGLLLPPDLGGLEQDLPEPGRNILERLEGLLDPIKQIFDSADELAQDAEDRVRETLGILPEVAEEAADGVESVFRNVKFELPSPDVDFGQFSQFFDFILDGERDLLQDIEEAHEQHSERMAKIDADLSDKLIEIAEDRYSALEDAQDAFNSRSEQMQEDHNDKLNDIDEDLDVKLRRIQEDADDARENARRKRNKKLEDIEDKHQKRVRDIMRKFDLARLKALIDRDARALFEAEERKRLELAKAQEQRDEDKRKEKENFQEELRRIAEQEAKKARRAQEDADRRTQDEIDRFKKQLARLEKQLEEQREKINENADEQAEDAKKAAEEQRKESKKQRDKQIKDLEEAFKEMKLKTQAGLLDQRKEVISEMDQTGQAFRDAYADWLDDLNQFMLQFGINAQDFFNNPFAGVGGGGGGGFPFGPGGGGGGGGGPPPGPPCADIANISFVPSLQNPDPCTTEGAVGIAPNCSRWICVGGSWRLLQGAPQGDLQGEMGPQGNMQGEMPGGMGPQGIQGDIQGGGQVGPFGRINRLIGGGRDGFIGLDGTGGGIKKIPVTIDVKNDETLREIFKSMSYEAFVEITEE